MQTSLRVDTERRDALAQIAAEDLGGVTIDEALRVLIFEHRTRAALARLAEQPGEMQSSVDEAQGLAEVDTTVEG